MNQHHDRSLRALLGALALLAAALAGPAVKPAAAQEQMSEIDFSSYIYMPSEEMFKNPASRTGAASDPITRKICSDSNTFGSNTLADQIKQSSIFNTLSDQVKEMVNHPNANALMKEFSFLALIDNNMDRGKGLDSAYGYLTGNSFSTGQRVTRQTNYGAVSNLQGSSFSDVVASELQRIGKNFESYQKHNPGVAQQWEPSLENIVDKLNKILRLKSVESDAAWMRYQEARAMSGRPASKEEFYNLAEYKQTVIAQEAAGSRILRNRDFEDQFNIHMRNANGLYDASNARLAKMRNEESPPPRDQNYVRDIPPSPAQQSGAGGGERPAVQPLPDLNLDVSKSVTVDIFEREEMTPELRKALLSFKEQRPDLFEGMVKSLGLNPQYVGIALQTLAANCRTDPNCGLF